jgi:hypothetical protein
MTVRSFAAVLATVAVMTFPFAVQAQHEGHHKSHKVTVQGEILDMACYVGHDAKGPGHAKCAVKCLKEGQPMGLLAKDGTVYWLFGDHDDMTAYNTAKDFGGRNVEVTGDAADGKGVKAITIQGVKAL